MKSRFGNQQKEARIMRTTNKLLTASVCLLLTAVPLSAIAVELDPDRGVLTLAGSIEPAMAGVVQILNYETATADNPKSSGSGAVIDADDGIVMTNSHVVDGAGRLRVVLNDGQIRDAELVGADPATDLALVRIANDDLVEVPFGNSASLKVGDIVLAIGYPFGLDQTVTMGIVSGLGRTGVGSGLEDFIQTDASINQGNSGGPLLDTRGRIVGVNTAIYSRSGGNVGIGFAVPTNIIDVVVTQLLRHGEVRRGVIGVSIRTAVADSDGRAGAMVTAVTPDSPAASAGLQAGDIVTAANDEDVRDAADLTRIIGLLEPDDSVSLVFYRESRRMAQRMTVGTPKAAQMARSDGELSSLGADFGELPSDHPLAGQLPGVIVTGLTADGRAATAGIREGDVITQVNQTPVTSLAELEQALSAAGGRTVFIVARPGVNALFPVTVQ
jgi:Do/DeqQ family serine protease